MAGIEGEPRRGEPTQQQTKHDQAPAQEGRHSTRVQREQQPYCGGVNKPEVPPPKELQLPFEPNLPRHEQQPGRLDPEVERLMRAYAEAEADGDPKRTFGSTGTEMSGRDLIGKRTLHRLVDFAASELESYQKGCQKQQGLQPVKSRPFLQRFGRSQRKAFLIEKLANVLHLGQLVRPDSASLVPCR